MKKIIAVTCMLAFLNIASAWASSPFEINKGGFGPIMKGFQLGKSTTVEELFNRTFSFGFLWPINMSVTFKNENSTGCLVAVFWGSDKELSRWEIARADGIFESLSKKWKLGDFLKYIDQNSKNYPQAEVTINLINQLLPGGGFYRVTINKEFSDNFRYSSIMLNAGVFNAESMPLQQFIQAVVNAYNLGDLEENNIEWYRENYKEGWRVIFYKQLKYLKLEAMEVSNFTP